MRIYISGPMRGHPDHKERFADAASAIRAQGHSYVNPALLSLVISDQDDAWYLNMDSYWLLMCDAITLLPGWENSKGARQELAWAKELGLKLYDIGHDTFGAIP